MTLNANALTTVAEFLSATGRRPESAEVLSVFRGSVGTPASATVVVTATTLTIGSNIEQDTELVLANYADVTAIVAAINAVEGWRAVAIKGTALATDLAVVASQSCLLVVNTVFLEGEDNGAIVRVINAASDKLENWCDRKFKSTTYTRLYSGSGFKDLLLDAFPIIDILRIAIGRQDGINARFTGTDAEDATVEVDATGVNLVVIGGTNDGTNTLTFASSATLSAMVTAIGAVSGWTAELINSNASAWASTQLLEFFPRNSLNQSVGLMVASDSVDEYDVQHDLGIIKLRGSPNFMHGGHWGSGAGLTLGMGQPPLYPLGPDRAAPLWPPGTYNIYCKFTAGFATLPADLVDGAIELANNMMLAKRRDTGLASRSVDGYSSAEGDGPFSKSLQDRLYHYRNLVRSYNWIDV